ncbi:MAG TPA: molybdopterin-dependent oxidoreductase [Syntrophorhabdaceae bacterium]|nr:molybdopterin-dependent oxidoreductase [Syntrophorhabdaceae bacterium]
MKDGVLRTTCGICQIGCGALVHFTNGRPIKIEGDPLHPLNKGKLCQKGYASLEYLYHPKRITKPLKRVGARGQGKWMPVGWDEALNIIADKFIEHKKTFGPESVAFIRGAAKGLQDSYLTRFANAFGSPNITSMAYVCFIPRYAASMITYGFYAIPDLDYPPKTIIVWGANISDTLFHVYERLCNAVRRGAVLIVVDPGSNRVTREASMVLKPKPTTDLHLILAMLHVIIKEGLYDKNFVEQYTTGFRELANHVSAYTPEQVSEVTWIPADTIVHLARVYALNKPSAIQWGNGIDHTPDNFQTARAICILRAITGNIGIPGGDVQWTNPALIERGSVAFSLHDHIPPEVRAKRITKGNALLPNQFYALPQALIEAMITGVPYPIKSCYIQGCNPLLTYPNPRKVCKALEAVDFLTVSDMFMTPTASLADIVLPVATYLEFDSIVNAPYSLAVTSIQQKATRVGECRSDYEILKGLADRLGLANIFWPTEEECLDFILSPSNITFAQFRDIAVLEGRKLYRDDVHNTFPTPSGKVELYSTRLESWGFAPLPKPTTEIEVNNINETQEDYPLILTSNKVGPYRHSGGRQITSLRNAHPSPRVLIHPDTAKASGIREGELVTIQTRHGFITQKASFDTGMHPHVILVDFAWWFPERESDPMFGWDESNLNMLIHDDPPFGAEFGTPRLRGIHCRIKKHSRDIIK